MAAQKSNPGPDDDAARDRRLEDKQRRHQQGSEPLQRRPQPEPLSPAPASVPLSRPWDEPNLLKVERRFSGSSWQISFKPWRPQWA